MDRRLRRVRTTLGAWSRADRLRQARWARQRVHPPRSPRGWETHAPDFVGVGVEKAGTSWWYRLIARHPDVVTRGHPKELDHFTGPGAATGIHPYHAWFPRPPGKRAGEWTPRYLDHPQALVALQAEAPDARILVSLRDPVERYISGRTMAQRRAWADAEAVARSRGRYGAQLERLLSLFPADQVLVLQFERCRIDTLAQLAATYRFLGLDDGFVPRLAGRPINATVAKIEIAEDLRRELVELYEPDVMTARRLVPELDLTLWPNFTHLA